MTTADAPTPEPNPEPTPGATDTPTDPVALVDELASGYRHAQILMTGVRLGVFEALAAGPADARELAARLGADPRGVRILCDALTALGILDKSGPQGERRYQNGTPARAALLPDSPRPKVAMLRHGARLYERWGKLLDAVADGRPVPDEAIDPRLASDERAFAFAMADVARDSAVKTADALERSGALAGVRRILDLGGGPGHYAVELARRLPDARAVVFDREATAEVARETARDAGVGDRVTAWPGDAFDDDLLAGGPPYDLILISNLVHIYPPEANRRLIGRSAAALAPGGRLAIKEFLLEPDRVRPRGAALFAVNMLVSTEAGDCYTVDQVHAWFEAGGLVPGATLDVTEQSRLALGTKP